MINRRDFIHTGCAAGAITLAPNFLNVAEARFPRGAASTPSGFNLGRSQINLNTLQTGGEFPFLNLVKTGQLWGAANFASTPITPDMLDANGYPTTLTNSLGVATGGVSTIFFLPTQDPVTGRPGNYVASWTGNGSIGINMPQTVLPTATFTGSITAGVLTAGAPSGGIIQKGMILTGFGVIGNQLSGSAGVAGTYQVIGSASAGSQSMTATGGSTSGSGGAGRYVFSTTGTRADFRIMAVPVTNLQMFHVDDEAALNAGQVFGVKFKQRLAEANFGVIRFLNWQSGNTTNVTTWATRKPAGYVFYEGAELRSALYCGTTSSSVSSGGIAYTASRPATHSSDNTAWTTGGPKDKDTFHVTIGASAVATLTAAASDGAGNTILTLSTGTFDTTFANGESIQVYDVTNGTGSGWSSLNGTWTVSAVSGNTLKIPVNSSAFTGAAGFDGNPGVPGNIAHMNVTLSVNGSSPLTVLDAYSNQIGSRTDNFPVGGTFQSLATLVYDASLNALIKQGGCAEVASQGIVNYVPPELMVQLCSEVRAHPYFITPPLAIDPVSDYMPSLAAYCQANGPSWMIPRFEGCNELWNTASGFYQTEYAMSKATANGWGPDFHNWYGKVISVLGQAVAQVYGISQANVTTQTKYQLLCGVQTTNGRLSGDRANSVPRLASTKYLGTTPQAPLSGSFGTITFSSTSGVADAKLWVTHLCCAQYIGPSLYGTTTGTPNEVTLAANFAGGDTTAPATYVDTLNTGSGFTCLANELLDYTGWKTFAQSFSIQKMCGYEGGYSPDYTGGGASQLDLLRAAGKLVATSPGNATGLQGYTAINYGNFVGLTDGTFTAEFPSHFNMGGPAPSSNAWSVLEDIYQTPNPPQWLAFIAFNH
jgi:hypothetical protein